MLHHQHKNAKAQAIALQRQYSVVVLFASGFCAAIATLILL